MVFRRTPIPVPITVMPLMAYMVISIGITFTAIMSLGHVFTAEVGEAMAGEDMVGIEIEMDNSHVKVNSSSLWSISIDEETIIMSRRLSIVLMILIELLTSGGSMARGGGGHGGGFSGVHGGAL
jgi:hypothetical protein